MLQLLTLLLYVSTIAYATCPTFNPNIDICCDGVLSSLAGNNACCGTQAYNSNIHICCPGNVVRSGSTC